MALKRHHKIVIGSFSSIIIIYIIVTSILLNGIIVKQTLNHNTMIREIENLQADTQSKLNELTINLIHIKTLLLFDL